MILITVPHGKCRSLDGRDCDRRARIFGRYLHRYIPDSVLIENSPYRAEVDGNRIASRATPFRQDIRRALPEASLLLDAHSFTNEPGVWDFAEAPGVPLVVLSMAKTLGMSEPAVFRRIRKAPFVRNLDGSTENDIILEAWTEFGVPGILLEANEDLSLEEVKALAQSIATNFI